MFLLPVHASAVIAVGPLLLLLVSWDPRETRNNNCGGVCWSCLSPCALLEHVSLLQAGWLDLEHNVSLEAGGLVNNGGTCSLVVLILKHKQQVKGECDCRTVEASTATAVKRQVKRSSQLVRTASKNLAQASL